MKTPRGFIVWQRSGMKRAILYLARSFRRPPTNTPANHTKHSRRLTTNLVNYVTSSLNKLTLDPIPPIASVNDARVTISNRTHDGVAGGDPPPLWRSTRLRSGDAHRNRYLDQPSLRRH